METSVRGEDQKSTGAISPRDLVLADNGLHDGVESSFGSVQVARYGSPLHFSLWWQVSIRSFRQLHWQAASRRDIYC